MSPKEMQFVAGRCLLQIGPRPRVLHRLRRGRLCANPWRGEVSVAVVSFGSLQQVCRRSAYIWGIVAEHVGNIRPTYIKRVAIDLVQKHNEEFSDDFEHNKQVVNELTDVKTSTFRNRIAGYVTTYRKYWVAATVEAEEEPEAAEAA